MRTRSPRFRRRSSSSCAAAKRPRRLALALFRIRSEQRRLTRLRRRRTGLANIFIAWEVQALGGRKWASVIGAAVGVVSSGLIVRPAPPNSTPAPTTTPGFRAAIAAQSFRGAETPVDRPATPSPKALAIARRSFVGVCLASTLMGFANAHGQVAPPSSAFSVHNRIHSRRGSHPLPPAALLLRKLYRFAAVEFVPPSHQPTAIAIVLSGGIVGAVVGPEYSKRTKASLPEHPFVGTFLASIGVYALNLILILIIRFPPGARGRADTPPAKPAHLPFADSRARWSGAHSLTVSHPAWAQAALSSRRRRMRAPRRRAPARQRTGARTTATRSPPRRRPQAPMQTARLSRPAAPPAAPQAPVSSPRPRAARMPAGARRCSSSSPQATGLAPPPPPPSPPPPPPPPPLAPARSWSSSAPSTCRRPSPSPQSPTASCAFSCSRCPSP